MRKLFYVLFILGSLMILAGIVISSVFEDCYNKTPKEFFDSHCRWLINNG